MPTPANRRLLHRGPRSTARRAEVRLVGSSLPSFTARQCALQAILHARRRTLEGWTDEIKHRATAFCPAKSRAAWFSLAATWPQRDVKVTRC